MYNQYTRRFPLFTINKKTDRLFANHHMLRNKRARFAQDEPVKPSSSDPVEGEVRARLEDFSRYFESVGSQLVEAKAELERSREACQSLQAANEKLKAECTNSSKIVETVSGENAKIRENIDRLRGLVKEIEAQNNNLAAENRKLGSQVSRLTQQLQEAKELEARFFRTSFAIRVFTALIFARSNADLQDRIRDLEAENDELEKRVDGLNDDHRTGMEALRAQLATAENVLRHSKETIDTARAQFVDCITLEENANCIPLTSGQMTNFEGLVRIWLSQDSFNGDVWFPFSCPITKKTTMPVADLSSIELFSRVGICLGLKAAPPFFFRYNANPVTSTEPCAWEAYTLSEQLAIFSKLVLSYRRRNAQVRILDVFLIFIDDTVRPAGLELHRQRQVRLPHHHVQLRPSLALGLRVRLLAQRRLAQRHRPAPHHRALPLARRVPAVCVLAFHVPAPRCAVGVDLSFTPRHPLCCWRNGLGPVAASSSPVNYTTRMEF